MKIFKKYLKNNKNNKNIFFELNEIFLDSKNLPNFDSQQFEGKIETAISKKTISLLMIFFFGALIILFFRLYYLQIQKGAFYFQRSQNNFLQKIIVFADRGIIYDRNDKELVWNKKNIFASNSNNLDENNSKKIENFSKRSYISPGFSLVLGYTSEPSQDKHGKYWKTEFIGEDGIEKIYNKFLTGENGFKLSEVDARGNIYSENIIHYKAKRGNDLKTTLDSRLQIKLFNLIKENAEKNNFQGGVGIIIDIRNGEILTSVSFPEYDSETLSSGASEEKINSYLKDKRKVFLNRTISGLYAPGSIIKPFIAIGALKEGIIDADKKILSTEYISIKNPYSPNKETIFRDWKAHGWVNMREAIALSSDIYFYAIGGGYKNQNGLGISLVKKYTNLFGLEKETEIDLPNERKGLIPTPDWKKKNFPNEVWTLGNTYHTSIGQYGFQVTPIAITRAIAAIANYGKLVTPHFNLNENLNNNITAANNNGDIELISIDANNNFEKEHFDIVRGGMRDAVKYGTAVELNVPYVTIAAKTGTAQIGIKRDKINSWITGFFPYENPKYAFTILLDYGPKDANIKAVTVMRQFLDWMRENTPEYFDN